MPRKVHTNQHINDTMTDDNYIFFLYKYAVFPAHLN